MIKCKNCGNGTFEIDDSGTAACAKCHCILLIKKADKQIENGEAVDKCEKE